MADARWDNEVDWAMDRAADVKRREMGQSLLTVGPDKPLGSHGYDHPPEAMRELREAKARLEASGRRAGTFFKKRHGQAFVYLWDEEALCELLEASRDRLPPRWLAAAFRRGRPHPAGFVAYAFGHRAAVRTPLFDVLADAYGDKTGPGRTDVLPMMAVTDLIQALERYTDMMDPHIAFCSVKA